MRSSRASVFVCSAVALVRNVTLMCFKNCLDTLLRCSSSIHQGVWKSHREWEAGNIKLLVAVSRKLPPLVLPTQVALWELLTTHSCWLAHHPSPSKALHTQAVLSHRKQLLLHVFSAYPSQEPASLHLECSSHAAIPHLWSQKGHSPAAAQRSVFTPHAACMSVLQRSTLTCWWGFP